MKTLANLIVGALLGLTLAAAAPSGAASESTHEVPEWMNRVCAAKYSVNCWHPAGRFPGQGPIFVRQMPGEAHMVCVFYADHPRRDYCA